MIDQLRVPGVPTLLLRALRLRAAAYPSYESAAMPRRRDAVSTSAAAALSEAGPRGGDGTAHRPGVPKEAGLFCIQPDLERLRRLAVPDGVDEEAGLRAGRGDGPTGASAAVGRAHKRQRRGAGGASSAAARRRLHHGLLIRVSEKLVLRAAMEHVRRRVWVPGTEAPAVTTVAVH